MQDSNNTNSNSASAEIAALPIVNVPELKERLMDDLDLIGDVLSCFFGDFPTNFQEMKEAIEKGDLPTVAKKAHAIKGASSNVSAERVMKRALLIEMASKSGNLDQATENYKLINGDFEEMKTECQKLGLSK
ncbi:MAG: Hpt domain-containing protein [Candidatus Riflebacteria bacterium]|nr:Hpt domain-containing protein [Candidatus Riflebacteria bacterium]